MNFMMFFWFAVAIIFLFIELFTLTFGFVFLTIGSFVIMLLLGLNIISSSDMLYQLLIILLSMLISFIFFVKTYKKLKNKSDGNFIEDMSATVISKKVTKENEGRIKWSGTIVNALVDKDSKFDEILANENVSIKKFIGNIAIIDK